MNRRTILLMLAILGALIAATLASQAQTPYPGSGDWIIDDDTTLSDRSLSIISGNVTVTSNGHLVLRNVDISTIASAIPWTFFAVEQGGTLEIYGCTFDNKVNPYFFFLNGSTIIDGTLINGTEGIYIRCWNVSITNNTVTNHRWGISFFPTQGAYTGPIKIADNLIQDGQNNGIAGQTGYYPGDKTRVVIVGNTIERISADEGIAIQSTTADGDGVFVIEDNTIRTCGGHGIALQLYNKVLTLRADGNDIEGAVGHGLWMVLNASVFDFPGINGLRSVDNNGRGLYLFVWKTPYLEDPIFSNITIQSCGGGIALSYVTKAILYDSIMNDTPLGGIILTDGQLDIYGSRFDKKSANVVLNYVTSRVRSWRTLDLTFKWLSGEAVKNGSIALKDGGVVLHQGTTDENGWMGNITVMDWMLTTADEELYTEAKPYVIGTLSNVSGPAFALVQDHVADAFIQDNVPPVIDFGEVPPEGFHFNTTTIYIAGTAFDDHSGVALVQVSIDPNPVWADKVWHNANGTTSWDVFLADVPDGTHQVFGRAYDRGNLPTGTVVQDLGPKVTVDSISPTITITSPVELANGTMRTNKLSVTVFGTVDSDVGTVEVDGLSIPVTSGTFNFPWGLVEGTNVIEIIATDGHGHITRRPLDVGVDIKPPVIIIVSPDDGQILNTRVVSVIGQVHDEVQAITLLVNQRPLTHTGLFQTEVPADSDGPFEITFTAEDDVGNIGTTSVTVIIDTIPPSVVLVSPDDGLLTNSNDEMITVRISDAHDISLINAASDETFMTGPANGEVFSWALISQEGLNAFEFICRDAAGNDAHIFLNVTLDTAPPSVVVTSPDDGQFTNQPRITMTGTLADVASLEVDGDTVTGFTDAFTHEVDLVEGPNSITVTATDAAGNSVIVVHIVNLDSFPPWLSIDNSDNGRIEAGGSAFDLTGTTDLDATVTVIVADESHQVTVLEDGTFRFAMELVADETVVLVIALDPAGNEETREATIIMPRPDDDGPGIKPTTAAAVAVGSTAIIIAAMASMEFTKYALILLFLPLYARIRGKEVLDNKTRYALHGLIVENPGLHYNEIIREFGLTNGVAAYHLDVLEREGFLRAVRDGTMKRFFSTTTKVPNGFRATPEETREMILDIVAASPGMSQKAIVDELGIGRTLVGYHLKNLVQDGYLDTQRRGRFTLYNPTKKRRNM